MKNIYVKKIVSQNPIKYESKILEEMIGEYADYCIDIFNANKQKRRENNSFRFERKSFSKWLRTEI